MPTTSMITPIIRSAIPIDRWVLVNTCNITHKLSTEMFISIIRFTLALTYLIPGRTHLENLGYLPWQLESAQE